MTSQPLLPRSSIGLADLEGSPAAGTLARRPRQAGRNAAGEPSARQAAVGEVARRAGCILACAGMTLLALLAGSVRPAAAQLDPLIGLKRLPPNVVIVMDTSVRMMTDGNGNYYDIKTYTKTDDATVSSALGITAPQYRRIYQTFAYESTQNARTKFSATNIVAVQSTDAGYSSFWSATRFLTAKTGILQAVNENPTLVRWGLLKLRQNGEAWRSTTSSSGCDKPVRITSNAALAAVGDSSPCSGGGSGKYAIYVPGVNGPNSDQTAPGDSLVYGLGSNNATTNIQSLLGQTVGSGALIPAGQDASTYTDRPIYNALVDARAHVVSAIAADASATRSCRNTVVVLIAGGKDDGSATYLTHGSIATLAGTFASVPAGTGTRRVPIVVIAIKPQAADESQLQSIATSSGGHYFKALSAADVTSAVNYAVQLGFSQSADLDAMRSSEFEYVSPVVGTVNLENAQSSTGALLPNTEITSRLGASAGQPLPQRSNFLLTAGFGLPGFDGRLRAFRSFAPVADDTMPGGWKFVKDGTRLWPDLDDRPTLAGLARTPISPDARNIYTYIPDASGSGGQMVAFTAANGSVLSPYLGGADPATLIAFMRSQPLGGVIGSTPAIMDPPSLDPPPDEDYGFPDSIGTFAGTHKDRRSIIFFGGNDGMIHALDARTGYEVWAFIPFNLLPKLRTLLDGEPVEQFEYFVDSSPKIAEEKIGGAWRSMLIIGEGYGGTFYQAFDVSEAGMGVDPTADGLSAVTQMLAKFDTPNETITLSWAFPRYSSFDATVAYSNTALGTAWPGGVIRIYGDLKSTASNVEKRVGFTFSDPAVGPVSIDRSVNAVITASGVFPDIEDALPGRGTSAPRAGHALFLLDAATGLPLGNASGGSCAGTGCFDVGDVSNGRKNALQADVTASGDSGSTVVVKAYIGDVDGKYWRFAFTKLGVITSTLLVDTQQPIFSSSALLFVGTIDRYLFFGTGSDLLPNTAPGGGSTGQGTAFTLYGVKDGATSGTVVLNKALSPKVSSSTSNLFTNGERPTSAPTVAGDIVFFTTTTDGTTYSCGVDASTKLYAFTYTGTAAYDTNANGKLDNSESPVVATTTGRGTAPFIVDQHIYMGVSAGTGTGVTVLGDSQDFNNGVGQVGIRILSWREIR
jgi:hypothetical protein